MNKTAQNLTWDCLPLEVKKEVKRQYQIAINAKEYYTECTLEYLFGIHNLTSDAEGEEMLTVSRKQIDALQGEIFKAIMDAHDADDWQDAAHYILDVMPRSFAALFGSKCLPDDGDELSPVPKQPSRS